MTTAAIIFIDRWLTIFGCIALGVQLVKITGGTVPAPLLILSPITLSVMAAFKLWASRKPARPAYQGTMRRR